MGCNESYVFDFPGTWRRHAFLSEPTMLAWRTKILVVFCGMILGVCDFRLHCKMTGTICKVTRIYEKSGNKIQAGEKNIIFLKISFLIKISFIVTWWPPRFSEPFLTTASRLNKITKTHSESSVASEMIKILHFLFDLEVRGRVYMILKVHPDPTAPLRGLWRPWWWRESGFKSRLQIDGAGYFCTCFNFDICSLREENRYVLAWSSTFSESGR